MKMSLVTSLVIGLTWISGALPALAADAPAPAPADRAVQPLPAGNLAADKDGYLRNAHADMQEWRAKLRQFDRAAAAKGHAAGTAAKKDLHTAWAATQTQSRRLEKASAQGWERAKLSFEAASEHLRDAWHRVAPDGK